MPNNQQPNPIHSIKQLLMSTIIHKAVILYAEEDKDLLIIFKKHLASISEKLEVWSNLEVSIGSNREDALFSQLSGADIVLLLVSANLLASQWLYGPQMEEVIENWRQGKTRLVPVILRSVIWKYSFFGGLRPLPTNEKPVELWENQDESFATIIKELSKLLDRPENIVLKISNDGPSILNKKTTTLFQTLTAFFVVVTLLLASTFYSFWQEAERTDLFLYETLNETLRLAVKAEALGKVRETTKKATAHYGSLSWKNERAAQVKGLCLHYEGRCLDSMGESNESIQTLENAVEIRRSVLSTNPSNHSFVSDLGHSLTALGIAYQHKGLYKDASDHYDEAVENLAMVYNKNTSSEQNAMRLCDAYLRQARVSKLLYDLAVLYGKKESIDELKLNVSIALDKCYKMMNTHLKYTDNMSWDWTNAYFLSRKGEYYLELESRPRVAIGFFTRSLYIRQELTKKDSQYSLYEGLSFGDLAVAHEHMGEFSKALEYSQKAESIYHKLIDGDSERKLLMYCDQRIFTARQMRKLQLEGHQKILEEVKSRLDANVRNSESKDLLTVYATACLELNETDTLLNKTLARIKAKGTATADLVALATKAKLW